MCTRVVREKRLLMQIIVYRSYVTGPWGPNKIKAIPTGHSAS